MLILLTGRSGRTAISAGRPPRKQEVDLDHSEFNFSIIMNRFILLSVAAGLLVMSCKPGKEEGAGQPLNATEPPAAVSAERGAYLVTTIGCADCHSPKIMGEHGPIPDPDRQLSGHPEGEVLPPYDPAEVQGYALFTMGLTAAVGPWGTTFAANLTPDETGIGNWSEEQFIRAMKEGQWKGLEGTRKLLPPMPWVNYSKLSEADLKSIFIYLRTLKPVKNTVPPYIPPAGV